DGAAATRREQPIVDLELVPFAVAVVTDLAERTALAFKVARAQVIERQSSLLQVPCCEPLLDPRLTLEQPVHRRIQILFIDALYTELLRQRRRMPPACGRELAVQSENTGCDHGTDLIAFLARARGDQALEAEPLHGYTYGLNMAVRTRAKRREQLVDRPHLGAGKHGADRFDLFVCEGGEVGECALADLLPFAVRL